MYFQILHLKLMASIHYLYVGASEPHSRQAQSSRHPALHRPRATWLLKTARDFPELSSSARESRTGTISA